MSRATALVAREHELDRALHSLRFSGGVLITGEAGVGKTLLAAAVADRCRRRPVAWLMATAASRATPLGALSRTAAARPGHHPSGPGCPARQHPAAGAQRGRPAPSGSADPTSDPPPAPPATAPPVLVVDDAQLLDPQSAAVLLSLVSAKSVRLLATMRAGETPRTRHRPVEGAAGRADGPRPAGPLGLAEAARGRCSADRWPRARWRCCGRAATETRST